MLLLLVACAHAPDPVAGADKYDIFCSSCHGADGTAGVQVDGVPATDLAVVPSLDTLVSKSSSPIPPAQRRVRGRAAWA